MPLVIVSASGWHQTAELTNPDPSGGGDFGQSVAVSDDTLTVGDPDYAAKSGRVFAFPRPHRVEGD